MSVHSNIQYSSPCLSNYFVARRLFVIVAYDTQQPTFDSGLLQNFACTYTFGAAILVAIELRNRLLAIVRDILSKYIGKNMDSLNFYQTISLRIWTTKIFVSNFKTGNLFSRQKSLNYIFNTTGAYLNFFH